MKKITYNNIEYELIEEYKDGFDYQEFENDMTEFFEEYDYIVGDWAYGKLRLKGFCDKKNKNYNKINDYQNKDMYIKEECAYECRYFVLKKNRV